MSNKEEKTMTKDEIIQKLEDLQELIKNLRHYNDLRNLLCPLPLHETRSWFSIEEMKNRNFEFVGTLPSGTSRYSEIWKQKPEVKKDDLDD